jgi:N-acetyl-alpha-D-glucosaminyl L-malate synthase BshA
VKRHIEVIPNFIRMERYAMGQDPALRKRFAPNGEKLLVHVSNFRPVKRVQDVMDVFMGVRKEMPARLLLIGDGPDRQLIEAQCRAHGICDEVCFLGKMTDPEAVVASCDLFVLTSETESFGLAALEAMACGVPVVSTDAGGTPEVVESGVAGLLNAVGDVAAMTAHALTVLSDPRTLAQYRAGALRSASRFDLPKVLPRYEDLYHEVVLQVKADGVHQ